MSYESTVSQAILRSYSQKLDSCLQSDAVVVGAGPAGLVCARKLADAGLKVALFEKRLAPGGGLWGGGMGMNDAVIEEEMRPLLEEAGVRHRAYGEALLVADACELAAGLLLSAMKANATLLNLTYLEDLVVKEGRVSGVVANRTLVVETLPVDPLSFDARAVVDATGHEAVCANLLRKRGLLPGPARAVDGEGPMDVFAAETFVVENTGACFPGLYLAGMSVCSVLGGPRMGPIFGGMLRSGARAAERILADFEAGRCERTIQ